MKLIVYKHAITFYMLGTLGLTPQRSCNHINLPQPVHFYKDLHVDGDEAVDQEVDVHEIGTDTVMNTFEQWCFCTRTGISIKNSTKRVLHETDQRHPCGCLI